MSQAAKSQSRRRVTLSLTSTASPTASALSALFASVNCDSPEQAARETMIESKGKGSPVITGNGAQCMPRRRTNAVAHLS